MHASPSFLCLAAMATVVMAVQMQINYYSDYWCQWYIGQLDVTWANLLYDGPNNCFNFQWGESIKMATCAYQRCICNFWRHENCQGGEDEVAQQLNEQHNCLDWAADFKSFTCYYA